MRSRSFCRTLSHADSRRGLPLLIASSQQLVSHRREQNSCSEATPLPCGKIKAGSIIVQTSAVDLFVKGDATVR